MWAASMIGQPDLVRVVAWFHELHTGYTWIKVSGIPSTAAS